jgi:hypothetical protein
MALPPAGPGRRVPGRSYPAANRGGQTFLWLIEGPDSEGDWNERERRARRRTLRTLATCVPLIWYVMAVRLVAHLPNEFLWWALFLGFLYRGVSWLVRYAGNQPTRKEARSLVVIVTTMNMLLATRLAADDRVAWLFAVPASLFVTSILAKRIATGFALWTTHVHVASSEDRSRARGQWRTGSGTPELGTIWRGRVALALGQGSAVAVWLLTNDGICPWLAFFVVTLGAWCLFCSLGRAPHQVAAVTWRTIVLWASFNPPLPDGETRLEPYTYQMPDPWVLLYDRSSSLRMAIVALAVAVVAVGYASGGPSHGPDETGFHVVGDLIIDVVRYVCVLTITPFLLFFTVLFATYGTVLTDYYARFAAVAVADARRRSPT